jgi:hypothetical protein
MKTTTVCLTKAEVVAAGMIDVAPYSAASTAYKAIHADRGDVVHIPHSDVYFVRAALEKHTGFYFPLDRVEAAMKAEGWRDRKGKLRF